MDGARARAEEWRRKRAGLLPHERERERIPLATDDRDGRMSAGDHAALTALVAAGATIVSVGTTAPIYNSGTATAPVIAVSPADTGMGTNGTVTGAERQLIQDLANITSPPSTDANGWEVSYEATAKRVFRKRWLAITATANPDQLAVNAGALPVGMATLAALHIGSCEVRHAGTGGGYIHAGVVGAEATTTLTVRAVTLDGSDLDAMGSAFDLFVTLAER